MKKVRVLCVGLLLLGMLSGCTSFLLRNRHPSDQPGTTWRTEDGTVVFSVKEYDPSGYGYIQTEEGKVDIVISMGMTTSMILISYADEHANTGENQPIPTFARWTTESVRKNTFVVRVNETVYFEPGQLLTFHKVPEQLSTTSETTYPPLPPELDIIGLNGDNTTENRSLS